MRPLFTVWVISCWMPSQTVHYGRPSDNALKCTISHYQIWFTHDLSAMWICIWKALFFLKADLSKWYSPKKKKKDDKQQITCLSLKVLFSSKSAPWNSFGFLIYYATDANTEVLRGLIGMSLTLRVFIHILFINLYWTNHNFWPDNGAGWKLSVDQNCWCDQTINTWATPQIRCKGSTEEVTETRKLLKRDI